MGAEAVGTVLWGPHQPTLSAALSLAAACPLPGTPLFLAILARESLPLPSKHRHPPPLSHPHSLGGKTNPIFPSQNSAVVPIPLGGLACSPTKPEGWGTRLRSSLAPCP